MIARTLFALALTLGLPGLALADDGASPIGPALFPNDPCTSLSAIVTRPTVSNSVCTVRPDHVLIETGYLNVSAPGAGQTVTYPQAQIRIGTKLRGLELDLFPPQIERTSAGGTLTGTTDVGAGLKYVIGTTPKLSYGVQGSLTAPSGLTFSNGVSTAYGAINAAYTISPAFSLGAAVASQTLGTGTARYTSFVPSLVLGATLPGATTAFAEVATFSNGAGPGTPVKTQEIVGLSHDVGQRVQVDVSRVWSPTSATGIYRGIGFGVSVYF